MAEPDYKDDLAFAPKFGWSQLSEWVREKVDGAIVSPYRITVVRQVGTYEFYKNGDIFYKEAFEDTILLIAEQRTIEQLKKIMEGVLF